MGLSDMRCGRSYRARICGKSVSSARAASSCTAAMAACNWYAPIDPFPRVAVSSAMPSVISFRSHKLRSCFVSGIKSPSGPVRAVRRASVSNISASNPATSVSSGSKLYTARVSRRLMGQFEPLQLGPGTAGVAFVENQVEHVQHDAQPFDPLLAGGQAERHAGSLDAILGPADALRRGAASLGRGSVMRREAT